MTPAVRWVVVGAGGIGGGLGGALARDGHDVHLVARGAHLDAMRSQGLRWRTPDADERLRLPVSPLDAVVPQDRDVICLATKLQDAEAVLVAVRRLWGRVPVVTWTNGIAAQQWAATGGDTVAAAVLYVPASHLVPGEVCVWGQPPLGLVHLGTPTGDPGLAQRQADALARAGFWTQVHEDLAPIQHAKWISNLAGAPQALVVPEDWEAVAHAAMDEGRGVFASAGRAVAPADALVPIPFGVGTIAGQQRRGGSTWQSLHTGRPLESAHLNGALVALAHAHGTVAPLNAALADAADRAHREGWTAGRLAAGDLLR